VVPLLAGTLLAQTATKPKTRKSKPAEPAVTAQDLQSLRDAIAAQQQQIEQLRQEVQQKDQAWQQAQQQLQQTQSAATEAQQKAAAAESASSEQKEAVSKLSSDMTDVKTTLTNTAVNTQEGQKSFAALESAVGHIKFSGDLRLRFEPFFGGGPANVSAPEPRMRERYRLRFNVASKINNDFAVGFPLLRRSGRPHFHLLPPIPIHSPQAPRHRQGFRSLQSSLFQAPDADRRQVRIYLATHGINLGQ
jgi:hypothetical protein